MSEVTEMTERINEQKEVLKSAIKKIVDATVDIGVELYFNSRETGETKNDKHTKSDRDSTSKKANNK